MKKVLFELEHTLIALLVMLPLVYFGLGYYGLVFVCSIFVSRELTQAEYRWIEKFGQGKRKNLPWWGQVDYRVWDIHSLIFNLLLPILLSIVLVLI